MSSNFSSNRGETISAQIIIPSSFAFENTDTNALLSNNGLLKMLAKERIFAPFKADISKSSYLNFHRLPCLLVINVRSPSAATKPTLIDVSIVGSCLMYLVSIPVLLQWSNTNAPATSTPIQLISPTLWPSRVIIVDSLIASPPIVIAIPSTG